MHRLDDPSPRPTPETPEWLEDLRKEWLDPREFRNLWQDDWVSRFKPLYSSTLAWRRVWRKGQGLQAQGYFVRDNLLFKLGPYSDRLCVPCPDARVAILQRLHDLPIAGHCGRHKTVARIQERYYWTGMWTDIKRYVLSCVTCQRNRAVKRAPWGDAQVIGVPDFCWQHVHMDWTVGFPNS